MDILVLGGTGAMGVALVKLLSEEGHNVFVTSRSQKENNGRIRYLLGDAHDMTFLQRVIAERAYNAIVDFMHYGVDEFAQRQGMLLDATSHYLFLSSSRVYAQSKTPITEESPRLLDICQDTAFLATEEYALAKARQEDILIQSGHENWTIIRPYITYSEQRLQLGALEKEHWLYRAMKGKTVVFPKDVAARYTTLTAGKDVAFAMATLIGNSAAFGQAVHITAPGQIRWDDVAHLYMEVIEKQTGKKPSIYYVEDSTKISKLLHNGYKIQYDRQFDRSFNSAKAEQLCEGKLQYTSAETGLQECLLEFLQGDSNFRKINWKWEALQDKLTHEWTTLQDISSIGQRVKYMAVRLLPWSVISRLL